MKYHNYYYYETKSNFQMLRNYYYDENSHWWLCSVYAFLWFPFSIPNSHRGWDTFLFHSNYNIVWHWFQYKIDDNNWKIHQTFVKIIIMFLHTQTHAHFQRDPNKNWSGYHWYPQKVITFLSVVLLRFLDVYVQPLRDTRDCFVIPTFKDFGFLVFSKNRKSIFPPFDPLMHPVTCIQQIAKFAVSSSQGHVSLKWFRSLFSFAEIIIRTSSTCLISHQ